MKKIYLLLAFFPVALSNAQINTSSQWTWVKGDIDINMPGIYGTMGAPAPSNKPGARKEGVTWKDLTGNFWLFGGDIGPGSVMNDLWKYDIASNLWTWVKGDNVVNGVSVYGTQGVSSPANKPGGRTGSVSWTDNFGNLWLFGGKRYDDLTHVEQYLNDLWKYDPLTNQWTWMKGDNTTDVTGIYGVQGTANILNKPGAREKCISWKDALGNLWLFGGQGYASAATFGFMNDAWKYDPLTNQWTWVKGDNVVNVVGTYGTQGTPAASNKPGARIESVAWVDLSGNFWLFAGNGYTSISNALLNDLWKFNPSTNEWTWMKGDNVATVGGVYGTQGVAAAANKPPPRTSSVSWRDPLGNLWLFAGAQSVRLNDLWKYDPLINQWTWIKGDEAGGTGGVYGTLGVADPANKPGPRYGGMGWTDNSGNLWLFGGRGFGINPLIPGNLNDLWKIANSPAVPVVLLNISATIFQKNVLVSWQTSQEINSSHFIVERSYDGRNFSPIGSVTAAGNSSSVKNYSVTDLQAFAGVAYYRIKLVDKDGASRYSSVVSVSMQSPQNNVSVFPNPVVDVATLTLVSNINAELKLHLYDEKGRVVATRELSVIAGNNSFRLDMTRFPRGVYTAIAMWGNEIHKIKILKE